MKRKQTEKGRPFRNLLDRLIINKKLRDADSMWRLMGHSCFEPFPPSFYYGKTDEEINQIFDELIKRLYEIIDGNGDEPSEADGGGTEKSDKDG